MAPVSKELLDWQANQKVKETWYDTKTIVFFGRSTPIILQNENGPCPLLALCNILLLRNKLGLNPYATCVSERKLLTLVAESLFGSNSKAEDSQTVSDAIGLLPLLAKGLDVNVRFTRIQDIEFTTECAVFGLLNIPVYHGWIIDPEDTETSNAIGSKSYNTLTSDLVDLANRKSDGGYNGPRIRDKDDSLAFGKMTSNEACSSSANAVLESSIEMTENESRPLTARQGELVKEFFDSSKTQLTVYGLLCLKEGLEDRELCVFFHNNHLSTMLKYEGTLYTLVTDIGYQHKPGVIWERLSEVNGNTVYVNKNFEIYTEAEASTSASANLSCDPQLAKVFEKLVIKGKHSQRESEDKQPRRISSAPFSTRSNVGPEHEHSITPRNPPRLPSRKESKSKSKRWKEKCRLM